MLSESKYKLNYTSTEMSQDYFQRIFSTAAHVATGNQKIKIWKMTLPHHILVKNPSLVTHSPSVRSCLRRLRFHYVRTSNATNNINKERTMAMIISSILNRVIIGNHVKRSRIG